MKRLILSILAVTVFGLGSFGQNPAVQPEDAATRRVRQSIEAKQSGIDLPAFDLNFPGGTPQELVDAIQKEIGTLNAVIPTEDKDVRLPPLKMRGVNAKQLFEASMMASQKRVRIETGVNQTGAKQYSEMGTSAGFHTVPPITPESVWYFLVNKPQPPVEQGKIARYYQLGPFLSEYKIDDVTTAIQAGWKMLGETDTPQLNFHEDTKLLIAVGRVNQLQIIDSVLAELGKGLKNKPVGPQQYGIPFQPQQPQ